MNAVAWQVVIAGLGVIVSVCVSAFISGTRWGAMSAKMTQLEKDIAEIKGMFVLRLRD